MRPALAGALTSVTLLAVYGLTLAPGVTFWDAGELITAAETLSIPHPPGTPLWVLVARVWSDVLGFLPRAMATNLLAAVSVSAATGIVATMIARWSGHVLPGIAAGLCAGAMSTVWLNATETEAYALALLLSAFMLYAGDRAGTTASPRWLALTAYLFALAVPLHLSALVAAPAALVLAARGANGKYRRHTVALLGAVLLGAAAVGTVATVPLLLAVLAVIAAVTLSPRPRAAFGIIALAVLGLTVLLFLPLRAGHDPWLNSQNPTDWTSLWELVGRRQYGEHPLWPRRSPIWAQLGMLAQYGDWQVALGVTPGVVPSVPRVSASAAFVALAVHGSRWHRASHPRSWLAMLVLLACGTLGIVAYMNFRAGPTFGHGLLPPGTEHEPRERDYFFLLGFWCWGLWAGIGALRLGMRLPRVGGIAGLALAALPIALNWRAVDRSREPEASLPSTVATVLLSGAPARAVLITAGDNDTYPSWYAQSVERSRTDVVVIVSPMLNARWYREEITRRYALMRPEVARQHGAGEVMALREIVSRAVDQRRPFVLSSSIDRSRRLAVAPEWTLVGVLFEPGSRGEVIVPEIAARVDTTALRTLADRLPATALARVRVSTDPTSRFMATWLGCPEQILGVVRGERAAASLATACKL